MAPIAKPRAFDLVYNAAQQVARLTFETFSSVRPDEQASFTIVGPYCELRRSKRERLLLKIKNRLMLEVLRKAQAIHVAETGRDGVVWTYRLKQGGGEGCGSGKTL